jgi:hypothetical protein
MELISLSFIGFLPETKVVLIRSSDEIQESFSGKLMGEIRVGEPMPLATFRKKVTGICLLTNHSIGIFCGKAAYTLTVQTKKI